MPLFSKLYEEAFHLFKQEKFQDSLEKLAEAEIEYNEENVEGIN